MHGWALVVASIVAGAVVGGVGISVYALYRIGHTIND